jgi:protein involved in polysaccharide export with SLBB domain
MPRFSSYSDLTRLTPPQLSSRLYRCLTTVLWALAIALTASFSRAQTAASPTSTTMTSQSDQSNSGTALEGASNDEDDREDTNASSGIGDPTHQATLSSDQIIDILQQSPDLVMELKSQLADRMQQQGVQLDPNEISDQMLYSQIASNAELRANITTVLRARGYVTGDDLQSMGSSAAGQDTLISSAPQHDPHAVAEGAAATQFNADSPEGLEQDGNRNRAMGSTQSTRLTSNQQNPRMQEKANASTDLPKVVRQHTPYNLQSMRDLYAQIPDETLHLQRFGSDVFVNRDRSATARGVSSQDTPLDVPLGPDYIVGAGDTLTIDLWGGVTQSFTRTVDRGGHVFLPDAGSIEIAGLPLGKAQDLIEGELKKQYRDVQIAITVSRMRSVRVYVVGDVQRPGGYDISALATPLGALYAAGGPTAVGSLRMLSHYRGKELVENIDLYDFLLHGMRGSSAPFQSGDSLLVPPAGMQVSIFGAVKRPAIYELKTGETTLSSVFEDAGGLTAAASLSHIRIERIGPNHQRETVTLHDVNAQNQGDDQSAAAAFQVRDGDRIRVDPILPYSQRAVYLVGHVVRPGRLPYSDGMRLSNVLKSYPDMLPEPSDRGEIVRLVAPDLHAETINFNVPDVLIGNANVDLQPFDTIRIFGRYQRDAPQVTIRGEVLRPGKYPMSNGMTAAQLVRMAGGFKRDALLESADLTSYEVTNGSKVVEDLQTLRIGDAVIGKDPHADAVLKAGDILAIHQITSWNDIGESVTINGQVGFPGNYGFKDGERLSSVLRRAGGLLPTAYPAGAVLVRVQVKELEQKSRDELIRQIETNSAAARLSPSGSGGGGTLQLIKAQQDQVLADLKSHPPTGRMVIHINDDIGSWANTPADIELRRGDVLTIPKQPGFVLVTGQVYNATALTFAPGKTAAWYLSHAGGSNATADRKEIFIIRANGSIIGRHSKGWLDGNVLSSTLDPGDVVVVPQKILGTSLFWKNLLMFGQLAASAAITAGVATAAL